ncbi:MAG TPA: hypothetical protein VGI26_10935 [Solirubrobacteraceae bacterium]
MRLRHLKSTCALLVLVPAVLAGCGGSSSSSGNGVASKSPTEIVSEAKSAADSASSVHVSGSVKSAGAPVTLDLNLASGKGGKGEISQGGYTFKLILVGQTAYISGSSSFYKHLGGTAAASLLAGKWLKVPVNTGEFASFSSLTDMRKLIDSTLTNHGTLKKGSTSTVGGQQAIAVTDSTNGGSLYVATTGKPYPLQLSKGGSESGTITFGNWNEPVTIEAPANSVDLSELKSLSGH